MREVTGNQPARHRDGILSCGFPLDQPREPLKKGHNYMTIRGQHQQRGAYHHSLSAKTGDTAGAVGPQVRRGIGWVGQTCSTLFRGHNLTVCRQQLGVCPGNLSLQGTLTIVKPVVWANYIHSSFSVDLLFAQTSQGNASGRSLPAKKNNLRPLDHPLPPQTSRPPDHQTTP